MSQNPPVEEDWVVEPVGVSRSMSAACICVFLAIAMASWPVFAITALTPMGCRKTLIWRVQCSSSRGRSTVRRTLSLPWLEVS